MFEFVCLNCKSEFNDQKCISERHGLDTPPYETLAVCPYCGSEDFVHAHYCNICEHVIYEKYYIINCKNIVCEKCYDKYRGDLDEIERNIL